MMEQIFRYNMQTNESLDAESHYLVLSNYVKYLHRISYSSVAI